MNITFISSGIALLLLIFSSFWLVYSHYLEDHITHGWIFLLVFLGVYFHFFMLLFDRIDLMGALPFMGLASLILITQWPFALTLFSHTLIPDASRGLKLIKTYSAAERKAAAEDLPGAIAEYEKVLAEDPGDITARFRLADLFYQDKEYQKAVDAYRKLVEMKKILDQGQQCSALMRLSEIHAQNLNDAQTARRYLQDIMRDYADTKFAQYAQDRLNSLQ